MSMELKYKYLTSGDSLAVSCPDCGAPKGESCVLNGVNAAIRHRYPVDAHMLRIEKLREQLIRRDKLKEV